MPSMFDGLRTRPCVGCGYCCTEGPCGIAINYYGSEWVSPCPALVEKDVLVTLMLFLESLIKETHSSDVISLAAAATISRATELGIDEGSSSAVVNRMLMYVKECQSRHPFAPMF